VVRERLRQVGRRIGRVSDRDEHGIGRSATMRGTMSRPITAFVR
jgi:hypothetical protein